MAKYRVKFTKVVEAEGRLQDEVVKDAAMKVADEIEQNSFCDNSYWTGIAKVFCADLEWRSP